MSTRYLTSFEYVNIIKRIENQIKVQMPVPGMSIKDDISYAGHFPNYLFQAVQWYSVQ